MITYHLRFPKELTKQDSVEVLQKLEGYRSLYYLYDKYNGTAKGYAFAKFEKPLSAWPTKMKEYDVSWSIAKDKRRKKNRPCSGGGL
ncbi:hypothetical protein Ciccas_013913 [Cichlidogyrus casuarinus]|uniref:RRM domain-containing protein n=1 Tax=Cichlidogyrus casuarinus TaxID=1844966 RepID=A0ABD2PK34_9PLAT